MLPSKSVSLQRVLSGRALHFQLARYLAIGGFVFVVDVGLFWLLVNAHVFLAAAVTIAYCVAVCVHFTLNKYANFRAHDRPWYHQASTYAVVAFVCWVVTLIVVEFCFRIVGLSPLVSKVTAVAVNMPVGFVGHRFLTFGPGVVRAIRRVSARYAGR